MFQDLVVGPADPLRRLQLLEVRQGVDLVELLLGVAVDEGDPQAFQAAKQWDGDRDEIGLEGAGGAHPEHIDDLTPTQLLLQAVLIEVEFDPLQLERLPGAIERQFQQLELVFVVEVIDRPAGDLDGESLCLCQQRQAQTQSDEPFHSLLS
ncbi:hypothetical protein D3C85_1474610 [compost metagenome]